MVKLHDLEFEPYLEHHTLQESIKQLAKQISEDYKGKTPLFLGILNGAFMFLSDLMKYYEGDCEISFIVLHQV